MLITHITQHMKWEEAKIKGFYEPDSLSAEGFIHCSSIKQVLKIANHLYKGQQDLLLLVIDESKVKAETIWEDLYNLNEEYPHIYGALNIEAVINTYAFSPKADGTFTLPPELNEHLID